MMSIKTLILGTALLGASSWAQQPFPSTGGGSPYNPAFQNPSNGFFPPGNNGFVSSGAPQAAVAYSFGSPSDQQMWATYAQPATNPYYSQTAANAAMNRQRMMLMAQMRYNMLGNMGATLAGNAQCYASLRGGVQRTQDVFMLQFSLMSANSMGTPMGACLGGGAPMGFTGSPSYGGMMAGMPSYGSSPYYSPQTAQLQLQQQAMQLQQKQQDLAEQRFQAEQKNIQQQSFVSAISAIPQTLSIGLAAAGGSAGRQALGLNASSRGASTRSSAKENDGDTHL